MSTGSSDKPREGYVVRRILVVEDDAEMRALLADVLRENGNEVVEASNGAEALIRLRAEPFAAIVLDKNMPGLSGLDLLPGMRTLCPDTPVIMITAFGDIATYVDAVEKGASAYLFKPFRMEELLQALRHALSSARRDVPAIVTSGGAG
ncbi:MAG TPA: response regulator [Candidatus Methylomirabilis sp.]|nr:response regulator [Candidatus Methylomirabilis sp.]